MKNQEGYFIMLTFLGMITKTKIQKPSKVKSTGGLQDVVARFTTHTILNDDGEVDDGDDGGGGGRGAASSPHADGAVLDVPVQ